MNSIIFILFLSLQDQYDSIASHTQKGIDFLEKYGHFVDQRCKIEKEYASKLRKLVRTSVPKEKKDEDDYPFTCTKAYKNILNELGDQAGQHELIAENLSTSVVLELASLVKQLKEDRRKVSFKMTIKNGNDIAIDH